MYYLKGDVITEGNILKDKFVEIVGDKVTYVGNEKRYSDVIFYEVASGFICPGFTDIHIHGVNGFDFMDNEEAFEKIANLLPHYGVTSFLATSRTAPIPDTKQFLEAAKSFKHSKPVGSQLLGVHMEGPWISTIYCGAQSKSSIRQLTWVDVNDVITPFSDIISIITLAPEELEDYLILEYLVSQGIYTSAGHSNATMEEIGLAIDYGLKKVTHTFNAMSPLHHRTPGTAAAALYYDELICEIITDGIHIDPKIIELLYKVKGHDCMVLISDCTGYNELSDGGYYFRNKNIRKKGNEVTLENGKLAGSALTLDKGIKYVVEHCNIPIEEAIYMATQAPLNSIGELEYRGKVKAGHQADLVILDSELNVKKTIIKGNVVYERG
ncbi:N-acetylglucosamine-6-phosphate deacetylase [Virgibacillus kekensis]|uniref:N-acetylglucosamine-6-phosphate deacetylase n=1 Tax=Virgibacillus kekensis TaxID=202261 RepID=A0ABV9DHR4_9BACI